MSTLSLSRPGNQWAHQSGTASGAAHIATPEGESISVSQAGLDIVANQSIAYTGTAGTSAAVNAATTYVIVTLTTDGYIAVGSAPTATTGDMYLPAFVPSPPIRVTGSTSKISAIREAVSGTMKIAELN